MIFMSIKNRNRRKILKKNYHKNKQIHLSISNKPNLQNNPNLKRYQLNKLLKINSSKLM